MINNSARSASVWRGIAVAATLVAVLALGMMYQKDVGNSLIWLGETMSGNKTKASSVTPAEKPADSALHRLPTTKPEIAPDNADGQEFGRRSIDSTDPRQRT